MSYSGGIKDLNKVEEGYCFQIIVLIPLTKFTPTQNQLEPKQSIKQTWIFCHDKLIDKKNLIDSITKLKIEIQRKLGLFVQSSQINQASASNIKTQGDFRVDGRWVLVQDWTQCSLKCGGGMKYQQYVCIPPKFGGRQCEGEAVRSMSCNSHPCPDPSNINLDIDIITTNILSPGNNQNNKNSTIILPAVVKTMAVSDRPLQYDKCYLKESDGLMIKEDDMTKNMVNKPRIAVRLVLNNKTLSAYLTDNINYMLVTFLLNDSVFIRSQTYDGCFEIRSPVKSSTFCELEQKKGWIEEWDYDFNLFKNQCKEVRVAVPLKETSALEKEFKSRLKTLKEEFLREISERSQISTHQNYVSSMSKKVETTHNYYLIALKKEVELDNLLKKEEIEREIKENSELEKEIELEKKKEDCLGKAIKEKEIESQYNLAKNMAEGEIKELEERTKREIIEKRWSLKKDLEELRKRQYRNKIDKKMEISHIRYAWAEKMSKLSKKGDALICQDKSNISTYCKGKFGNNFTRAAECIKEDSFCEICCENEFGGWWLTEREKCFQLCILNKQKKL